MLVGCLVGEGVNVGERLGVGVTLGVAVAVEVSVGVVVLVGVTVVIGVATTVGTVVVVGAAAIWVAEVGFVGTAVAMTMLLGAVAHDMSTKDNAATDAKRILPLMRLCSRR